MQAPGKPQEAYRFFEKGSIGAFVLAVVLVLLLNPTTGEIAADQIEPGADDRLL